MCHSEIYMQDVTVSPLDITRTLFVVAIVLISTNIYKRPTVNLIQL